MSENGRQDLVSIQLHEKQTSSEDLENLDEAKIALWMIIDFLFPIKSLQDPILGYSSKKRANARLWRIRLGLSIHIPIIIVSIAEKNIPAVVINSIAVISTINGHFDNRRRIVKLLPLKIRKILTTIFFV